MPNPHFQLYINGQFLNGSENQTLASNNPATGEPWATFACASKADVEHAVAAAGGALSGPWSKMTPTARGKMIHQLADLVEKHAPALGEIETTDSGKLAIETKNQTAYVADYYRYYAGLADKIQGATLPIDKPDMHVFTTQIPIGVVAAIVPWNAQIFLSATKIGPALAAGCTLVVKASEVAPCTLLEFAKLIHEVGFPPGVVSIVTGDAENCAVPLTSHPDVDRIAFTGGEHSARHVVRNSANNFAVTSLELGGKSPIIVFEDANVESAVNGLIAGNFGASGQSCVAGSRALIHRSIKEEVIQRISDRSRDIVIGDPLDSATHVGPLCTLDQVEKIEATLEQAVTQGASIQFGGKRATSKTKGNYFEPTLVDCPTPNIETLLVEMFGPVMSILAFDDEDEAIALANESRYGLGSGVFTENLARAHRVSSQIRSGICWINSYRAISPIAPFGGFNHSGYAREAGLEAIRDYTRTRTTWINISDEPMANPFVMR
ncbi:MAG: aldehyde dehydrogenase [Pseudomonadota bacterium]